MNRDFQKALPLSISVLTILAQSWKNNPHKLTCPNKGLSFHVGKMKVRTPGVGRDADGSIFLLGILTAVLNSSKRRHTKSAGKN